MNVNVVLKGGIIGGLWLLVLNLIAEFIAGIVAPYDIFEIGGMRSPDDPLMWLFFLYPFIFAFIAAGVYDKVKGSLTGTREQKGICFGVILIFLVLIPEMFIIFSSMTYPAGFYVSNLISGIIGFPVLGLIYAVLSGEDMHKIF